MTFLLDNTVVSNFGQVQRVDLLRALVGGRVGITLPVLDETRAGVTEGKIPALVIGQALDDGWLAVVPIAEGQEQTNFDRFLGILGRGEASCLAVATQRGWVVATDDRKARRVADQVGVVCTGTLGLLVAAIDQGFIDLATGNAILEAMTAVGFFAPVPVLDGLIRKGGRAQ